jgi:CubicO group peptidase (beta-lactamase class C family)
VPDVERSRGGPGALTYAAPRCFLAAGGLADERKVSALGETRQVVIIQGGRLVYERYAAGYGRDMRLISWSMAKSVTQALVGAAVLQGVVDINKPMGRSSMPPDCTTEAP